MSGGDGGLPVDPEIATVFLAEALGYLATLESPGAAKAEQALAAHGLKSAAGLVGLAEVQHAAEQAERFFRAGEAAAAGEHVARARALLRGLEAELGASAARAAAESPGDSGGLLGDAGGFDAEEQRLLRSFFLDEAHEHLESIAQILLQLEREPARRDLVDELLRKTHTLKGSAATVGLAAAAEASHRLEDVFAQLRAGRLAITPPLLQALVAAVDGIRAIAGETAPAAAQAHLELLGRRLAAATGPRVDSGPHHEPTRDDTGSGSGPHPDATDDGGTRDDDGLFDERRQADRRLDPQVLRVDVARVDALVDAAGELVFDRTRIERRASELRSVARELSKTRAGLRMLLAPLRAAIAASERGVPPSLEAIQAVAGRVQELEADLAVVNAHLARTSANLVDDTEGLRRTSSQLQTGLTQVRMMSVRGLFSRLARPIREAARRAGRRIEILRAGEETELDKTVAEQVADSLVQIVRNAAVHGIEPPPERVRAGKPAIGRVSLSARHQGDAVYIEVADDGAGIDAARIRQSLVARGRLSERQAAALTDEHAIAAIFEPGVSTRSEADELAGRGVGLDVVRESIARLGGEISVASKIGEGTRFTIRLPLTTAITQAHLFKIGAQVYAVPNAHVVSTMVLEGSAAALPSHVRAGEETVPLVRLHELLAADPPADARRVPALVVEFAGRRFACAVDKLVGPREIVVKSIGPLLAPLGLYAGATISGAGKVQLILDSAALAQLAFPLPEGEAVPQAIEAGGDTTGLQPMRAAGPRETGKFAAVRVGRDTGGSPVLSSPRVSGPMAAVLPPRRVLVVDDSRTVRETVSRLLAGAGYIVDTGVDGAEAWDMLKDVEYDLLITDLEMPRLDGYQLIERVRANTTTKLMPILVISSRSTEAHRGRASSLGASAFLAKPLQRPELVDTVGALLR